jgi:hypothetical protein
LKGLTVGTDAWEWIKLHDRSQDGHLAFQTLREHYDGPGEIDHRIALAKQQLKELHYKSEQSFSFEKFITRLNGAFQVLAECKEQLTEKAKVDQMILSMSQCTHSAIIAATTTIMMNTEMRNDFVAASNKMTEIIANVFPALQLHRQRRNVASAQAGGGRGRGHGRRGGRGRGGSRGRGQGGRGTANAGPRMYNGVDISDLTKHFIPSEWFKLSEELRAESKRLKAQKKRSVSEISTTEQSDVSQVTPASNAGNSFGSGSYAESASTARRLNAGQRQQE